jgi:6-pyruvoyltetrahydropterin/6-carboxytetrahydropterin synthase
MSELFQVRKHLGEISCAHRLMNHEGMCKYIHGHNYGIRVTLEATELNREGMVIDFCSLKKLKDELWKMWDHSIILSESDPILSQVGEVNQRVNIVSCPTAEYLAKVLYHYTLGWLDRERRVDKSMNRVSLVSVEVFETSGSSATYSEKNHENS